jgi:class 3 adenylate cyclase
MVGTAVIAAARLSSVAKAGQILLMPRSYAEVETVFVGEPVGEIQLKGFSHPVEPVNVVGLRDRVLGGVPIT